MKKCSICKKSKSVDNFGANSKNKDGLQYECKECRKLASKSYRGTGRYKSTKLGTYGLSQEQFNLLLEKQKYCCAICRTFFSTEVKIAIDHDHNCCPPRVGNTLSSRHNGDYKSCGNCVRGLLCNACNAGLGMFKDNPEILRRAISYLDESYRLDGPTISWESIELSYEIIS